MAKAFLTFNSGKPGHSQSAMTAYYQCHKVRDTIFGWFRDITPDMETYLKKNKMDWSVSEGRTFYYNTVKFVTANGEIGGDHQFQRRPFGHPIEPHYRAPLPDPATGRIVYPTKAT